MKRGGRLVRTAALTRTPFGTGRKTAEQTLAAEARQADRAEHRRQVAAVYADPPVEEAAAEAAPIAVPNRAVRRHGARLRTRRRNTSIPTATRTAVRERAGHRCERCGDPLGPGAGQVHHRRPRGGGGSRAADVHCLANLLLLCLDCHGWVESWRAVARRAGLLVGQGRDPAAVAVRLVVGRVWLHPTEPRYLRTAAPTKILESMVTQPSHA